MSHSVTTKSRFQVAMPCPNVIERVEGSLDLNIRTIDEKEGSNCVMGLYSFLKALGLKVNGTIEEI